MDWIGQWARLWEMSLVGFAKVGRPTLNAGCTRRAWAWALDSVGVEKVGRIGSTQLLVLLLTVGPFQLPSVLNAMPSCCDRLQPGTVS